MANSDYFDLKRKINCPCDDFSCTAYGMPKGKHGHPEGCIGVECRNGRSSKIGKRKQVRSARALGDKRVSSLRPGNEETMQTFLRMEQKSTANAHPVQTFYDRTKEQSDGSRSHGDTRPFVAISERDGRYLLVMDLADWDQATWLTGAAHGWGPEA